MKEYDLSKRENLSIFFKDYLKKIESKSEFKKIEDAIYFAKEKHAGQVRKGNGIPYINHPVEVAILASHMTTEVETIIAAVLHDTLEDTDTTYEEIKNKFGEKVAELVLSDSEDKRNYMSREASWKLRKEDTINKAKTASKQEKIILLCDKLSNLRQTKEDFDVIGDKVWEKFNQKDKKMHGWYHKELLKSFSELKDYPEYKEYKKLVEEIFD